MFSWMLLVWQGLEMDLERMKGLRRSEHGSNQLEGQILTTSAVCYFLYADAGQCWSDENKGQISCLQLAFKIWFPNSVPRSDFKQVCPATLTHLNKSSAMVVAFLFFMGSSMGNLLYTSNTDNIHTCSLSGVILPIRSIDQIWFGKPATVLLKSPWWVERLVLQSLHSSHSCILHSTCWCKSGA